MRYIALHKQRAQSDYYAILGELKETILRIITVGDQAVFAPEQFVAVVSPYVNITSASDDAVSGYFKYQIPFLHDNELHYPHITITVNITMQSAQTQGTVTLSAVKSEHAIQENLHIPKYNYTDSVEIPQINAGWNDINTVAQGIARAIVELCKRNADLIGLTLFVCDLRFPVTATHHVGVQGIISAALNSDNVKKALLEYHKQTKLTGDVSKWATNISEPTITSNPYQINAVYPFESKHIETKQLAYATYYIAVNYAVSVDIDEFNKQRTIIVVLHIPKIIIINSEIPLRGYRVAMLVRDWQIPEDERNEAIDTIAFTIANTISTHLLTTKRAQTARR